MKKYINPKIDISLFENEAVLTNSITQPDNSYNDWTAQNPTANQSKFKLSEFSEVIKLSF